MEARPAMAGGRNAAWWCDRWWREAVAMRVGMAGVMGRYSQRLCEAGRRNGLHAPMEVWPVAEH